MFNININKNHTLEAFNQLVEKSFNQNKDYLPDSFNKEQQKAIELFKKRIFLEKTIEETVAFNKKLNFPNENKNLHLTTTAEELIEVFKLRSEVYTQINYQDEFPDTIEGLNFDKYDSNAAIIYCKFNNSVTATTRLIFDSHNKLPSERKFSLDAFRENYNTIGELSRLIVKKESKGLSLEFKNIMCAIHLLFMHNDIDLTFLSIIKEHYKLYDKFGGSKIIHDFDQYGDLGHPVYLLSWNPSLVSPFFKKAFLNQK